MKHSVGQTNSMSIYTRANIYPLLKIGSTLRRRTEKLSWSFQERRFFFLRNRMPFRVVNVTAQT